MSVAGAQTLTWATYDPGASLTGYVVLLRGVNVGGRNILPMDDLKAALLDRGFSNVKTYIQSGNVVLQNNDNPEDEVRTLLAVRFGLDADVLVLSERDFERSMANNPYLEHDGKHVHFYFCKEPPRVDFARLESLTADTESHELIGQVFYLYAPSGIGRSKLAAGIEGCLGVSATGRNLNTVKKLAEMLKTN